MAKKAPWKEYATTYDQRKQYSVYNVNDLDFSVDLCLGSYMINVGGLKPLPTKLGIKELDIKTDLNSPEPGGYIWLIKHVKNLNVGRGGWWGF